MSKRPSRNTIRWIRRIIYLAFAAIVVWMTIYIYNYVSGKSLGEKISPQIDSLDVHISREEPDLLRGNLYLSIYNFLPVNVYLDSLLYIVSLEDTLYVNNMLRERLKLSRQERHGGQLPLTINYTRLAEQLNSNKQKAALEMALVAYLDFPLIGKRTIRWDKTRHFKLRSTPNISLESVDAEMEGTGDRQLRTTFRLEMEKEFPEGSMIDSLAYEISIDDQPYITGKRVKNISLHKTAEGGILLPAVIDVMTLREHIRSIQANDSMWINTKGYAALYFPASQGFRINFSLDREMLIPKPPEIQITEVSVSSFDINNSTLVVELKVTNQNPFGLTFKKMNYEFFINRKLIALHTLEKVQRVDSNSVSYLRIPVNLKAYEAGWKALNMLIFKSEPNYTLRGQFVIESDIKEIGEVHLNLVGRGKLRSQAMKSDSAVSFRDLLREIGE
ncbi:MAG: LEA type 2 family protein [Bacteroidia bacterium]